MTPTLIGRWQTRLFLFATVGVLVTLAFVGLQTGDQPRSIYFWILGYITCFGFFWDIFYIKIQKFRWDRDWPGAFQLLAGIWEALFLLTLIKIIGLPGISPTEFNLGLFIFHYSCVWIAIFITSQSLIRILCPYWRFRGGQWF
ncbi:conserved membrane hypothetical protein [Planktothrix serta PCC 8927]|uniref:Uncharacterized protein n=1 Tax=Planktothrix serta PCC 8927 TaxID=671068 RepID=A0A7Z9DXA9_9CYAN|nr:hypothetical protein [Planktothrix serta]VXD14096.1 conserved membrane hypothetical protein [Planktothrix serta PCC 8927]